MPDPDDYRRYWDHNFALLVLLVAGALTVVVVGMVELSWKLDLIADRLGMLVVK